VHHLVGESASWAEQLDRWQEQQPAFALLSGVTSGQWQPVQDFCERRHVPCWFPSVDAVPPNAERALYSLYFSAGAALEAQAIAQHLKSAAAAPGKVVVIRGQGLVPEVTSRSLLARLQGAQAASLEQVWDVRDPVAVRDTMRTLNAHDAAVLLLSPTELAGLTALAAPASTVYLSAALAPTGLESLPAAWAARAYVVDRLERPKLRQANLKRFRFWLEARKLPLVDERLQSEAYVAATFLELTLADMLNNFHTDYLIERAEQTLSARESERSRQEVQAMMMGGGARRFVTAGEAVAHNVAPPDLADLLARQGASAYPRLSLGPGQRFASKGAYVVKWAEGADADSRAVEWIVP
jgi:hypothetical protein